MDGQAPRAPFNVLEEERFWVPSLIWVAIDGLRDRVGGVSDDIAVVAGDQEDLSAPEISYLDVIRGMRLQWVQIARLRGRRARCIRKLKYRIARDVLRRKGGLKDRELILQRYKVQIVILREGSLLCL